MNKWLLIMTASAVLAAGFLFLGGCYNLPADTSSAQKYYVSFMDGDKQIHSEYVERFGYAENFPLQDKEHYEFMYWEYNGERYSFSKPVTDNIVLNAKWQAKLHRVLFICDGVQVYTRSYTFLTEEIDIPKVPQKTGYTAEWERFSLTGGDITVNAIYTPVEYSVEFYCGDEVLSVQKYTVENKNVTPPALPQIRGCEIYWEDFQLTVGDVSVRAVIKRVLYFYEFYVDGELYVTVPVPPDAEGVELPELPRRAGYSAEWEPFEFSICDMEISAVYTPIVYYARFYDEGVLLLETAFTVLTKSITPPPLKDKYGYEVKWEDFILGCADVEIHSVYTATTYFVEFYDGETLVARVPFNVTTASITEPAAPKKQGFTVKWQNYVLECRNITVRAEYFPVPSFDKLIFTPVESGYELSGVSEPCSYVYVPAEYNGLPVLSVAEKAFSGDLTLDKIFFEGNVISIGASAFAFCSFLSSVTLCNSVQVISRNAFAGCAFAEIFLPSDLARIEPFAFQQCANLLSIALPDSLTEICEGAFNRCSSLAEVSFGKNLVSIEQYAFRDCRLSAVRFSSPEGWLHYDPDITSQEFAEPCDLSEPHYAAEIISKSYYVFFKDI